MRVVGSGLGRTGTMSLKAALERLLGGTCYHMIEVFGHLEHVPAWADAANGRPVDWHSLLGGFTAAVDWPASAYWDQLAEAYPDALILHSERDSAEAWFGSASRTIFESMDATGTAHPEWHQMVLDMFANTFTPDWRDADAAMAAYERHNADVRARAPKERLLVWRPGDGWEPLAQALGVDVPDEPFPHSNSSEEFRKNAGLDDDRE